MKKIWLFLMCFIVSTVVLFGQDESDFEILVENGAVSIITYTGTAKEVKIPDQINGLPVTRIETYAFLGNSMTSVTIPDSVSYIGVAAFFGNSLTSVTLPKGITLEERAFDDAVVISYSTTDTISEGFETVAVNNAVSITGYTGKVKDDLRIPDQINGLPVTSIGAWAFSGKNLSSVIIPNGVVSIGRGAFAGNRLTNVAMPNSLITIEAEAFSDNRINSVIIPNGVTSIGDWAFQYNNLTSITIPDSVTSIGFRAFANNALERVTLNRASVIEARAFDSSVAISYSKQTAAMPMNSTPPVAASQTSASAVQSIDNADFQTRVADSTVSIIGYTGVEKVLHIPEQINGLPVTSISADAFAFKQLMEVTIPSSVISIGRSAFIDNRLTSVTIPNSVNSIGAGAFSNNRLTRVTIPNSTYIGMEVFDSNVVITPSGPIVKNVATLPTTQVVSQGVQAEENSDVFQIRIENRAISIIGYTGAAKDLRIPAKIRGLPIAVIGAQAFSHKALTSVSIPDSVTTIGAAAFCDNALTEITIPTSVVTIGANAFANNRLTRVSIPNSVTEIGDWAFQHNRLISVSLGSKLRTIGASAFAFNRLTSITIPASVVTIGAGAFYDSGLTSVTFSNGVTDIEERAFAYNALTNIALPSSVSLIGDWAFAYNRLTSVALSNNAAAISSRAFSGNLLAEKSD